MKKLGRFLAVLCMIALCACMLPAALAEETDLSGEITFAFWDGNQQDGMQALIDAYVAQHPGVKINISVTPWNQYWQVLGAAAEGGMPDVFWMHSNNFVDFAKQGILVDCTDLYDKANFPAGISEVFQWEGKQLGVPKDFDTIALVYNKDLFDAAGVAYPDDTWDWDTLVDAAQKLTKDGVYGFAASAGEDQSGYLVPVYQAGGYTVKPGEKEAGYTDPKTIEGVQFWIDLQKKYHVSPTQEELTEMNQHDYFKSGQAAMVYLGSWEIKGYIEALAALGQRFDVAELPKGPTGIRATLYNGLTYAGYVGTEQPEIVKSFLTFLGTQEAAEVMGKSGAAIPAFNGTQDTWYDNFPEINVKAYPDMIRYGVQYPFSKTKAEWGPEEKSLIAELYTQENPDVAAQLAKIQEIVSGYLAQE
jgi:multiple sugar transport system substrate-binding protein